MAAEDTCSSQEDQWRSVDWPAAVRKNPEGEGSSDVWRVEQKEAGVVFNLEVQLGCPIQEEPSAAWCGGPSAEHDVGRKRAVGLKGDLAGQARGGGDLVGAARGRRPRQRGALEGDLVGDALGEAISR